MMRGNIVNRMAKQRGKSRERASANEKSAVAGKKFAQIFSQKIKERERRDCDRQRAELDEPKKPAAFRMQHDRVIEPDGCEELKNLRESIEPESAKRRDFPHRDRVLPDVPANVCRQISVRWIVETREQIRAECEEQSRADEQCRECSADRRECRFFRDRKDSENEQPHEKSDQSAARSTFQQRDKNNRDEQQARDEKSAFFAAPREPCNRIRRARPSRGARRCDCDLGTARSPSSPACSASRRSSNRCACRAKDRRAQKSRPPKTASMRARGGRDDPARASASRRKMRPRPRSSKSHRARARAQDYASAEARFDNRASKLCANFRCRTTPPAKIPCRRQR